MKTFAVRRIGLFLALFTGAATASTIPQSSCTFNNVGGTGPSGGFYCNLYPSNPDGTLNDIVTINFPAGYNTAVDPITPGYIIIVDPGLDPTNSAVQQNQADWLQVIEFAPVVPPPYAAQSIELLTLGCNDPSNPNDTSCFPSYATVAGVANYFDVEPTSVPAYSTPYNLTEGDVKDHEYNAYYFPEVVPEPASVATFIGGAFALALLGRRRILRKRSSS